MAQSTKGTGTTFTAIEKLKASQAMSLAYFGCFKSSTGQMVYLRDGRFVDAEGNQIAV